MLYKISDIHIPDRFRVEYGDLDSLADAIKAKGLINPITITVKDGQPTLVCGARRLLATMQAGLPEIECVVRTFSTDLDLYELELMENLDRKQFTWQEEVRAKAKILELRQSNTPPTLWERTDRTSGVNKLSAELDESAGQLSQDVQLAKALEMFPELLKEEKKTNAFKKLKMIQDALVRQAVASTVALNEERCRLWLGDSAVELKKLATNSVDLLLTDPPWGVDVGSQQFAADNYACGFDDSMKTAFATMINVLTECHRVLKENSHAYIFFGTKLYAEVKRILLDVGFTVEPIPLIWIKPGGGQNIYPFDKFTPNYETIFFVKKGQRKLTRPSKATFTFPVPEKKVHPTQKPVELLKELIELSSLEDELILDPFAGSGTTAAAALELKRRIVAVEKEETFYNAMKVLCAKKEEQRK